MKNGQHALDPVRRACPARPLIRPPLAIPGGPHLLLVSDEVRSAVRAAKGRRAGRPQLRSYYLLMPAPLDGHMGGPVDGTADAGACMGARQPPKPALISEIAGRQQLLQQQLAAAGPDQQPGLTSGASASATPAVSTPTSASATALTAQQAATRAVGERRRQAE